MKNILIPTTLQQDTIAALQTAVKTANGKNCEVVLLLLSETSNSYSSAYLLRKMNYQMSHSQIEVLENSREFLSAYKNCTLKIHTQYGISAPLLRNLLDHLSIGLTILIPSYKSASNKLHNYCMQLLLNNKCPILHTGISSIQQDFNKALYIETTKSGLQAEDLQRMLKDQLSFNIVSQAKFFEEQQLEEIGLIISETIVKNNIDLLIATRKPEKIKSFKKEKAHLNELGLPVLSLYEEMV